MSQSTPISIEPVTARAKLPAAAWRALATSERQSGKDAVCPVYLQDAGETVAVLPFAQWQHLMWRLDELERGQP